MTIKVNYEHYIAARLNSAFFPLSYWAKITAFIY